MLAQLHCNMTRKLKQYLYDSDPEWDKGWKIKRICQSPKFIFISYTYLHPIRHEPDARLCISQGFFKFVQAHVGSSAVGVEDCICGVGLNSLVYQSMAWLCCCSEKKQFPLSFASAAFCLSTRDITQCFYGILFRTTLPLGNDVP